MKNKKVIKLLKGSYEFGKTGKLYKQVVDFCREIGGTLRFYGKHFSTGNKLLVIEAPPSTKRIICYGDELGHFSRIVRTTYLYYVFEFTLTSRSRFTWEKLKLFCTRKPIENIRSTLYYVPLPNVLSSGLVCFDGVVFDDSIKNDFIAKYLGFWNSAFALNFCNCYFEEGKIPRVTFDRKLIPVRDSCFSLREYACNETKENESETNNADTNNNAAAISSDIILDFRKTRNGYRKIRKESK